MARTPPESNPTPNPVRAAPEGDPIRYLHTTDSWMEIPAACWQLRTSGSGFARLHVSRVLTSAWGPTRSSSNMVGTFHSAACRDSPRPTGV